MSEETVTGLTPEQFRLLGAHLRAARLRLNWRQADLAARAHVSQGLVSNIENTVKHPGRSVILALASALGMSLEALLAECGHCHGEPPAGFRCLSCGAARAARSGVTP